MTHAIVVQQTGGAEQLQWQPVTVAEPAAGEVRVRQTAVGLNFIDVYFRSGLYPAPQLPFVPGSEGAGVVEAVGSGVHHVALGDRVAYAGGPLGAYAEQRIMPAANLVKIPEGIDDETAAASMLKGMTAWYLLRRTHAVNSDTTLLLHAAAGGVGSFASQWAKALGATVIGTAGGAHKVALARDHGCDHVIDYTREDFVTRIQEITGGKGVPVVYDSVGQATFMASLDCLQPRGLMVSFGQSSGAVPPLDVGVLSAKGSLFLTRPTLFDYIAQREELEIAAQELFEQILSGNIQVEIHHRFPLAQAADAHTALEGRRTTGSTVLVP